MDKNKIEILKGLLQPLQCYNLHSRVHLLKTFESSVSSFHVKRDDELGFGISGSKIRKYASLLPFLKDNNIEQALVIGGMYSNNVVSLIQLLIENKIRPILFLRGNSQAKLTGNHFFTRLFVPIENIHLISREEWMNGEKIADTYDKKSPSIKKLIITEGACMAPSLLGSLTLALDIINNEQENNISFENIFIEAGTGLMAIALILIYAWLKKNTKIHILLVAGSKETFLKTLHFFKSEFEKLMGNVLSIEDIELKFCLYLPQHGRSFGSVNSNIFKEIVFLARNEGFLTDPIYSAKLFLEIRKIIEKIDVTGPSLIIHSGGSLSLSGFQDKLGKFL